MPGPAERLHIELDTIARSDETSMALTAVVHNIANK